MQVRLLQITVFQSERLAALYLLYQFQRDRKAATIFNHTQLHLPIIALALNTSTYFQARQSREQHLPRGPSRQSWPRMCSRRRRHQRKLLSGSSAGPRQAEHNIRLDPGFKTGSETGSESGSHHGKRRSCDAVSFRLANRQIEVSFYHRWSERCQNVSPM